MHLLFFSNIDYHRVIIVLGIIKGDSRYECLSKMMKCVYSSELVDFYNIDLLLLPFGGIDDRLILLFFIYNRLAVYKMQG